MRLSCLVASTCLLAASAASAVAEDVASILDANRAATGSAPAGEVRLTYAYAGQGMTGVATTAYDSRTGAFQDSEVVGPHDRRRGL